MATKEIEAQICGLQGQTTKSSFDSVSDSNKEAEKSDGDCVTKTHLDDSNVRNGRDPKSNERSIRNDYRTLSKVTQIRLLLFIILRNLFKTFLFRDIYIADMYVIILANSNQEEKKVKESYLFCCENFYSLPEMINYMKENHGVSKTTVTNVFRELLKGRNAEAYLRVSQKRMLQRRTLQRRSSGSGVGTSTK